MSNMKEKILFVLSHATPDINQCAAVFSLISVSPESEQPDLLETFFAGFGNIRSTCTMDLPIAISPNEKQSLLCHYGLIADAYLGELQRQALPRDRFYRELWRYIAESPVFESPNARIAAVYNYAIDRRLPYFPIDRSKALRMKQDTFQDYLDKIGNEKLAMMEHILSLRWTQRTEEASMLVSMLEELDDFNTKTVFMAQIIAHFHADILKLHRLERLVSMLSDED